MSVRFCVVQEMLPLAARTANGQSSGFDFGDANELTIFVNVTDKSGTNPNLDISIQTSPDNSVWYDHSDIETITEEGNYIDAIAQYGKYIRILYELDGTNPSFTFSVKACRKN